MMRINKNTKLQKLVDFAILTLTYKGLKYHTLFKNSYDVKSLFYTTKQCDFAYDYNAEVCTPKKCPLYHQCAEEENYYIWRRDGDL